MAEIHELYTFNDDVWADAAGSSPVMFSYFGGFTDAGKVGSSVPEYLLDHSTNEVLASFNTDLVHDYRARRPKMIFDTDSWKSVEDPALTLHLAKDDDEQPFLVLVGPEPDMRWKAMREALIALIDRLDVSLVLTAHGVPMTVPHTRSIPLTTHATDESLRCENPRWVDRLEVPASFSAYLELALGQHGRRAMGIAAHVPHYLMQGRFVKATELILERLLDLTRLNISLDDLREDAEANLAAINTETASSIEGQELIEALERQYDEFIAATDAALPSADELGAAFERFLAQQEDESS